MKTIVTVLLGVVFAAPASAGSNQRDERIRSVSTAVIVQQEPRPRPRVEQQRVAREEQSETLKKTVRIGNDGQLAISNISGNIEVKRGGGNEATIDIVKVARGRTVEEAREMLPLVNIDVAERGTSAEIRTIYGVRQHVMTGDRRGAATIVRNMRNMNVQVHYTVTAPAGTSVTAHSTSGSIRVTDIAGDLSLTTTSGSVQVVKGRRVSTAKTTSGDVLISDTDSDTPLEAGTMSGNVKLHRVKAPRMELSTVSGSVVMQDVTSDRIEAHALSGDVEFSGGLKKGGRYDFNSHSGDVKLAVSGGTGFEIEANSWSGNIHSELPVSGGGVQAAGGRGPRRKELKGVIGDGSAMVEVTTFSGSVLITKR